jgi:large subunit ribosomal protein L4
MAIKVSIYDTNGKVTGERELDAKVFGVKANPSLIQEVVVAQAANARESIAHTKTRGEVRGGGKKPWKQKHTGRARHGSTRSPIWKGGGVVFGPRNTRVWTVKVNKKAKQAAMRMILSEKVKNNSMIIVSELNLPEYKTKAVAQILSKLPCAGRGSLIAVPSVTETAWKSVANIPKVEISRVNSLNIVDVMKHSFLVITAAGVDALTTALLK